MELPWPRRGLYAITPDLADTGQLLRRCDAVLRGGAVLLQYRNKAATPRLRRAQAGALAQLCAQHRVPLIVNDDLALACSLGAGVHLGRDDADPAEARRVLGGRAPVGVSCYNELVRAQRAVAGGADYVAFGAFFASSNKPAAVHADTTLLREARALLSVPICAIGGITARNAGSVIEAGACLVAVIADLFDAADPCAAAQRYAPLFGQGPSR